MFGENGIALVDNRTAIVESDNHKILLLLSCTSLLYKNYADLCYSLILVHHDNSDCGTFAVYHQNNRFRSESDINFKT